MINKIRVIHNHLARHAQLDWASHNYNSSNKSFHAGLNFFLPQCFLAEPSAQQEHCDILFSMILKEDK